MVLVLLTEVVAFYMGLPIIEVREAIFQWSLTRSLLGWLRTIGSLSLDEQIRTDLYYFLKVFLGILEGIRGGGWSGGWSDGTCERGLFEVQ